MPRQGRLCEPFNRVTDPITGVTDTSGGSYEGGGTQVWEDGPQEAQWQWYARAAGGAPNTILACDLNGCYVNTVSTAENVNIQVGEEDKSVIIAYPARIYLKFNSTNSQTSGSNRHTLGIRFSNSDEGGESSTPTITFTVSCGTRSGATTDGVQVTDDNLGASGYTFFSIAGGSSYWLSFDYAPGDSMSVRAWAAGSEEPDEALITVEAEDGYLIPERIDGIELFVNPVASAGKTYFQRLFIDGHCLLEDWVSEPAPTPITIIQTKGTGDPTNVTMTNPCTDGNILLAYTQRRTTPSTGFAATGGWNSIGPGSGESLLDSENGANPDQGTIQMWWKPCTGGETNVGTLGSTSGETFTFVVEISGVTQEVYSDGPTLMNTQAAASHMVMSAVNAPTGQPAIILGLISSAGVGGPSGSGTNYTPDGGWSELSDNLANDSTNLGPRGTLIYQIVASAAASYNPGTTLDRSPNWCAIGVVFQGGVSEGI